MSAKDTVTKRLRSQEWFNDTTDPGMTALYIERYMNWGVTREELQSGKPIIGIAMTGSDLSPCNRSHVELADRYKAGIRDSGAFRSSFLHIQSKKQASDRQLHSTAI